MSTQHTARDTEQETAGPFSPIEEAIEEIRRGHMVVVCDGADRENEGDLVMAAQFATPEAINFMAKEARGLICLAMTGQRLDDLNIPLMVSDSANSSPHGTAFCVSIEARRGVSTGSREWSRPARTALVRRA